MFKKTYFYKWIFREANVLVLDEPTNHLDVDAKESLQNALKNYKGSVILVSHEPDFYLPIVDAIVAFEKE